MHLRFHHEGLGQLYKDGKTKRVPPEMIDKLPNSCWPSKRQRRWSSLGGFPAGNCIR